MTLNTTVGDVSVRIISEQGCLVPIWLELFVNMGDVLRTT